MAEKEYIEKGKLYDAIWDAKQEKSIRTVQDVLDFIDKFLAEKGEREVTCKDCLHADVCQEVEGLKCRKDFVWYCAESGCPYYKKAADLVEVVRCKDCVYFRSSPIGRQYCGNIYNQFRSTDCSPNDYCKNGVRSNREEVE